MTDTPPTEITPPRLNELSADEMFDVARTINPSITREAFEADWAEFAELKRRKALQ